MATTHSVFGALFRGPAWDRNDDISKCLIKAGYKIERSVEYTDNLQHMQSGTYSVPLTHRPVLDCAL